MKRILVEVSDKEHKTIKDLARSRYLTISGLLRMLLDRELSAAQSKGQAA